MLNNPDLVTLVSLGCVSGVKEKLSQGWNPNIQSGNGMSAINKAVERNDLEMLEVLVAAGGRLDVRDGTYFTPLEIAEEYGNKEMVKFIKDHLHY